MSLVTLLVYLLVLVIVFALVWWVLTQVTLPPPIGQFVRIICVVIFALMAFGQLFGFVGCALLSAIARTHSCHARLP
jgi:hypothetical protein